MTLAVVFAPKMVACCRSATAATWLCINLVQTTTVRLTCFGCRTARNNGFAIRVILMLMEVDRVLYRNLTQGLTPRSNPNSDRERERGKRKDKESLPSFLACFFFFRHCYLFLGKLVNKIPSPQISPKFLPPPASHFSIFCVSPQYSVSYVETLHRGLLQNFFLDIVAMSLVLF